MRNLPHHFAVFCITLWVGGMWMLGYLAVPALFKFLPDRPLAGMLAGKLFTLLAFVGIVCALYLLLYQLRQAGRAAWRHSSFRICAIMLLLIMLGQFVVQPLLADLKAQALPLDVMSSAFAAQFNAWHGVSSILFLIQSLLGLALVLGWKRPQQQQGNVPG